MLDDYSLRLLAEIGIDVYVPRAQAGNSTPVQAAPAAISPRAPVALASATAATPEATAFADVLILGASSSHGRLCEELLRSVRMARLSAAMGDPGQADAIARARGLLVLGEQLARSLGADMPAQRQNEITWIVSHDPDTLARSADAKRALWGEIKRLSRSQAARPHAA